MLDISLIGTGGMMPLPNRFLTSLLVRHNGKMLLIDCGEGTQVSLRMLGWGFKAIDTICFTHFHADHISGLPGLLLTLANSGKDTPLTIIGPVGLSNVVNSLRVISPELPYEIIFIERKNSDKDFIDIDGLAIKTLPVDHRIDCFAYSVELHRVGKFDVMRAKEQNIPMAVWSRLQKNETVEHDGVIYTSDMVLGENRKGIKISYCTDCRPSKYISEFVRDSDLFVCEGMYGDNEKQKNSAKYKHMIFSEAAGLARDGNVSELWLTHFSPAMTDAYEHLTNATDIFSNCRVGKDRMWKTFRFEQ